MSVTEWHSGRRTSTLARVRACADTAGVAGIVLTTPAAVSWATGAMNPPIDRTAAEDTVWLAVGGDTATVVTTRVEEERIRAELLPPDFGLVAVDWWEPDQLVSAAEQALGSSAGDLGSDGHSAFGIDLDQQLTAARLILDPAEQDELRDLGRAAAAAVEDALRSWQPGESDNSVAARISAAIEAIGGDAPVLIVGTDDRVGRYRHPVARGAAADELVMAVLVARRYGLHVALTRYAAAGETPTLDADLDRVRRIHRTALDALVPGNRVGDVYAALDAGYRAEGYAEEWRGHYQGGPIGYRQREFEIAPCQTTSPWWGQPIAAGMAWALNPSLPGGAKDEDTYLVTDEGLELVTTTTLWPDADSVEPRRPAILRTPHTPANPAQEDTDER